MRAIFAAFIGAVSIAGLSSTTAFAAPPLTVAIKSCAASSNPDATVTGYVDDYPTGPAGPMRQFLGIPYAAPPTGSNRWMPPKPVTCWNGNRDTMFFGSSCPQGPGLDPWENEDCLTLNVFTKATGVVNKQPVMVFIHGGGLNSGSGSFQLNPANLVAQGVVVVTINYRIGALGFLAHPALAPNSKGNFGILDQQAALKWVKTNIIKFGGDPANVTIFGQSAGGLSVLVHLLSPLSNNLFHKAIIESGAFYYQASTLSTAQTNASTFAANLGCGDAACLRAKPVANVLANQNVLGYSVRLLTQDNVHLKDTLQNLLMTGQFKKVPTIVGSTHEEMRAHINGNTSLGSGDLCHFVSNLVPGNYQTALMNNGGGSNVSAIMSAYPPGSTQLSANIAFAQQGTDSTFACRTLRTNRWMAQNGGTNYFYEFQDASAPVTLWSAFKLSTNNAQFPMGAYHGAESPYLFRPPAKDACGADIPALTPAQKKVSTAIVTYWTTFAKTGNPNPAGTTNLPVWPEFDTTSNGKFLAFKNTGAKLLAASTFDTDHKCAFWTSINVP